MNEEILTKKIQTWRHELKGLIRRGQLKTPSDVEAELVKCITEISYPFRDGQGRGINKSYAMALMWVLGLEKGSLDRISKVPANYSNVELDVKKIWTLYWDNYLNWTGAEQYLEQKMSLIQKYAPKETLARYSFYSLLGTYIDDAMITAYLIGKTRMKPEVKTK